MKIVIHWPEDSPLPTKVEISRGRILNAKLRERSDAEILRLYRRGDKVKTIVAQMHPMGWKTVTEAIARVVPLNERRRNPRLTKPGPKKGILHAPKTAHF